MVPSDLWGIVESTVDGMLVLGEDGVIRFSNPAAQRMFGRDLEGTQLGLPLAPSGCVEVDILGPQRGLAEMRLTPLLWKNEPAVLACLRDVTERERTRLQLREERDFFSALMENLGALVLITDRDLRVERVNRTFLEAVSLSQDAIVDRPLEETLPDLAECLSEEPPPPECETEWDELTIAWRLTTFGDHLICTGYDISERHRARELLEKKNAELEEARHQAEAGSRAKTDFLAMMSHELRTPMTAVLGMLELLLESELEEQQRDYVRLADGGARELLGVLDDILDISKVEAGHVKIRPRPFSLPRALERLVGVLEVEAERRQCKLELEHPDDLPETLLGDWGRLRQVLLNLVGNAIKFAKGRCGLKVEREGERFQFTVWDNGVGVAPEDQERIFQPFVQADTSLSRQHEGTGLGLAIAAALVARMGGQLELTSRPGQGSHFRFSLDLPEAEAAEEEGELQPPSRALSILLVEDNPISLRVATLMLENCGYEVDTAINGEGALERLAQGHHDAVLLDIQMPGMNGFEVFSKLRQREQLEGRKPIPVVALTAHCMIGERERCLDAGMDGFLTKPVDRATLHRTIAALLDGKGPDK
ncbi:MAG: ATP-binding protein [Vulcanimicrobiota bacterium]